MKIIDNNKNTPKRKTIFSFNTISFGCGSFFTNQIGACADRWDCSPFDLRHLIESAFFLVMLIYTKVCN